MKANSKHHLDGYMYISYFIDEDLKLYSQIHTSSALIGTICAEDFDYLIEQLKEAKEKFASIASKLEN